MTAETLRRAAALMRERAEWANEEPWARERQHDGQYSIVSGVGALGHGFVPTDAIHIASWHPAVALAVADLMDASAFDEISGHSRTGTHMAAVAVARAYLGETP